jgi:homotetrameric cytidine deaminase
MEKEIWDLLISKAKEVRNPKVISPFIEGGQVGAAILTKAGNIYTGVCIDTASTLGICAERNAIHTMITNGESKIDKIVCIDSSGKAGSPCGACRELIMQLDKDSKNIDILQNEETYEVITMEELMPDWWGYSRFE